MSLTLQKKLQSVSTQSTICMHITNGLLKTLKEYIIKHVHILVHLHVCHDSLYLITQF